MKETRPVLFVTFDRNDLDNGNVLDVSGSLYAARRNAGEGRRHRGFIYRLERLANGSYGNEQFIEELGRPTPPERTETR